MVLGMAVLGVPADMALNALGMSSSELHNDAPALMLFGMAITMTVPMVGWMRYRGHTPTSATRPAQSRATTPNVGMNIKAAISIDGCQFCCWSSSTW